MWRASPQHLLHAEHLLFLCLHRAAPLQSRPRVRESVGAAPTAQGTGSPALCHPLTGLTAGRERVKSSAWSWRGSRERGWAGTSPGEGAKDSRSPWGSSCLPASPVGAGERPSGSGEAPRDPVSPQTLLSRGPQMRSVVPAATQRLPGLPPGAIPRDPAQAAAPSHPPSGASLEEPSSGSPWHELLSHPPGADAAPSPAGAVGRPSPSRGSAP